MEGEAGMPLEVSFTVHAAENSSARLVIYPVPTSGVVNINHEGAIEGARMMLQDDRGNVLLSRIFSRQSVEQLDLSSYKKGTYYLKVISQQAVQVKRIVVE